jgi:hypothetical protein
MRGVGRPEPVSAGQGGGKFCRCPVDRPQVEPAQETGKGAYLVGSTVAGLAQYLGQDQDRPGADWVPARARMQQHSYPTSERVARNSGVEIRTSASKASISGCRGRPRSR